MTLNEQRKIINAAWKAAGFKGKVQLPEASAPDIWDLGGITIEPVKVSKKSILGKIEVDGYRVCAWQRTYSPEWGDDVDETEIGEFQIFTQAVQCAIVRLVEDKVAAAMECESMAMALAE